MAKRDSERGSMLLTVALVLVGLLLFLILAIDVGLGYVERRRVQAVTDAAALAGAEVLTDNGTDAEILTAVHDYMLAPNNPLVANELSRTYTTQWLNGTTVVGTVGSGARPAGVTGILVTATGRVPTYFANLVGTSQLSAAAQGGGGYSPLDVMLVLDRSGSMNDDSCMLKDTGSGFNLRDYIVTNSASGHAAYCGPDSQVTLPYYTSNDNCTSCGGHWNRYSGSNYRCEWQSGTAMTQAQVAAVCGWPLTSGTCAACKGVPLPTVSQYQPISNLKSASNMFVDQVKAQLAPTYPHMGLVTYETNGHSDKSLTDITNNTYYTDLKNTIINLSAPDSGNTDCQDGIYRARRELETNGRWTAVKVILFMSDGICNQHGTASTICPTGTDPQRAICEATYAQTHDGIAVYTIGLGSGADQTTLRSIASSSDNYLYAPSSADLQTVFDQMFQKIKRLRLVQ